MLIIQRYGLIICLFMIVEYNYNFTNYPHYGMSYKNLWLTSESTTPIEDQGINYDAYGLS
jgi:hypothetical protein